jgi:hypothetical protein
MESAISIGVFVLTVLSLAALVIWRAKASHSYPIKAQYDNYHDNYRWFPELTAEWEEREEAAAYEKGLSDKRREPLTATRDLPRASASSRSPQMGKAPARQLGRSNAKDNVRVVMQVVVSLAFLGAAVFIILSARFDPKDKHWAYGAAGTILGFWLKN